MCNTKAYPVSLMTNIIPTLLFVPGSTYCFSFLERKPLVSRNTHRSVSVMVFGQRCTVTFSLTSSKDTCVWVFFLLVRISLDIQRIHPNHQADWNCSLQPSARPSDTTVCSFLFLFICLPTLLLSPSCCPLSSVASVALCIILYYPLHDEHRILVGIRCFIFIPTLLKHTASSN